MCFTREEQGQGLVEYALVLVLIAIVVILILSLLGPQVGGVYARVMGGLNRQVVSAEGPQAVVLSEPVITIVGGNLCNYSLQDVTVIALDDGRGVANTLVTVRMLLDGSQIATATATTNGAGIVSSMNLAAPDACNGSISYSLSY